MKDEGGGGKCGGGWELIGLWRINQLGAKWSGAMDLSQWNLRDVTLATISQAKAHADARLELPEILSGGFADES